MLKETYIPDFQDVKDAMMDKDQERGKSQDGVSCTCVCIFYSNTSWTCLTILLYPSSKQLFLYYFTEWL